MHTPLRHVAISLVIISPLLFASVAFAETEAEGSASAEASVSVDAPAQNGTPGQTPLQMMKAKLQGIKNTAMEAKEDLRANTKIQMKNASTTGEKKEVMKGALMERKDIAKDRKASTTAVMKGVRNLVRMHGGLVRERFGIALRQFDKMTERIHSRIDKMKTGGADTASVEASLTISETAIAKAKTDVQVITDFIANVDDSATTASVKTTLQADIKQAQASIKAAHAALMDTVKKLVALAKTIHVEAGASASTTVETNSSN